MADAPDWDERYRRGEHPGPDPDPFLVRHAPLIRQLLPRGGTALDLAGGAGRNAAYAAGLGFTVTLVDASAEALVKARSLPITVIHADLERGGYIPQSAAFDLVMVFFYLQRDLFPAIETALRPGGILIYRTYTTERLRRHPKANPNFLLQPGELRTAFPNLHALAYEESSPTAALLAQRLDAPA